MHRQPGYRYEVECDEEALGAQAKHLDISYRSKGKLRFYTPKIKDWMLGGGFKYLFIFTPIRGRFPFWLIFFRWVETTN